ncbi:MAG: hypothetical protein KDC66_14500 [Phaeodactylibacter sp.]|nr:hypothetical protein [Phaeodactylibacter sp.]MCB9273805.1 hypothetical protein [Lewinellaceae bacterium]
MQRISTNLTLFYKLFIPVFWIVFFGSVTMAALLYTFEYVGNIPARTFRILVVAFYLSGLLLLAFTLMRLKRVEVDDSYFYVTNYFKTARYPFHNIEKVELSRFLIFRVATIHFHEAGIFGKRAAFVPTRFRFHEFWEAHPELRARLLVEA